MQDQTGLDAIVTEFAQWVKRVAGQFAEMNDETRVQRLEQEIREGGQRILGRLMQQVTQTALERQQEATRTCPHCGARRRHQGVRPRQLRTSLGAMELTGIYWKCPGCGLCGHSAEGLTPEAFSRLLRGLVCLVGTALTSFDKAELVLHRVLGVAVDDETTRRHCQKEGWALAREADGPPPPVAAGGDLRASCDGTMVHTREDGWREIKGYRLEHAGGRYGGAYLEKVERFAPRVKAAADRLGQAQASRRVFLSDMAEWIKQMVPQQLPGWKHIADYWHACQHIHQTGEALYGPHHPRARKWSGYWSRRLRGYGARRVADRMRRIVLHYPQLEKQTALLELIRFLDKHADRMDYPAYEREGLPISSGPMESFCKQVGLRLKGPGMHWSTRNVTPMAMLVSRWSLDPERASVFGALPAAA
jgi:hypothetical protein